MRGARPRYAEGSSSGAGCALYSETSYRCVAPVESECATTAPRSGCVSSVSPSTEGVTRLVCVERVTAPSRVIAAQRTTSSVRSRAKTHAVSPESAAVSSSPSRVRSGSRHHTASRAASAPSRPA